MSHAPSPAAGCGGCPLAPAHAGPADLSRRAFLSQAALAAAYAAAAAALAACGGSDGPTSPSSIPRTTVALADYPPLASFGGVATLTIGGIPVAVVRTGASSVVALSRACPHQGTTVNVVSGGFYCPNHGAQFNSTGTWTGGQSTDGRGLTAYPTAYDASAGTVTIG